MTSFEGSKNCDKVYLATDPDREGEAIVAFIKYTQSDANDVSRIEFNEITKSADKASKNPRKLNLI